MTIYLPDEIASRMEKYPEVNWSEVCRKAVADYVDTRSHADIGPILEKLKSERNEAYKQGQILFYQLAPKLTLREYEKLFPKVSTKLLESDSPALFGAEQGWSPEVAERYARREMMFMMNKYCGKNDLPCPVEASDAFWEGAIDAFMNIYNKIKPKKT